MDKIAIGCLGFLVSLTVLALFLAMTGYIPRDYDVLNPSDQIDVSGVSLTVEEAAKMYRPYFYIDPNTNSPPAIMLWWHAVDDRKNRDLVLIYHMVWEDEIHPNPVIHRIYRLYREIYYGTPVFDVEYVQINVSYEDGSIRRVRYEGTFSDGYYAPIHKHKVVVIVSDGISAVENVLHTDGTVKASRQVSPPKFPLRFGVASWSHQFVLLESSDTSYTSEISMPMKFLSDEEYQKYKFARKSQGDFVTREPSWIGFTAGVLFLCLLGLPYLVWYTWSLLCRQRLVFRK